MCANLNLITERKVQKLFSPIHLHADHHKWLNILEYILNNKVTLYDTLHIPTFKFNPFTVDKLSKILHIKFLFYPMHIVF